MKNILFFDTETTGLGDPKKPINDPCQPMPVQLGMVLDIDRIERGVVNTIIQQQDWTSHPKAIETHGITKEMSISYGTHFVTAYELFSDYVGNADTVVAHNAEYDIKVMRRAGQVYADLTGQAYTDPFEGKRGVCTKLATMDVLKLTPKRYGKWKWPSLEECMKHLFNEKLDGAHDALVDVRGMQKVFYYLVDQGIVK